MFAVVTAGAYYLNTVCAVFKINYSITVPVFCTYYNVDIT